MDSDIPLHIDIRSIRTRNATMLQPPSAKANTNSQASFIHFPENRELSCRVSTLDGFFKIKKFTFCWTAAFASAISVLRGGEKKQASSLPRFRSTQWHPESTSPKGEALLLSLCMPQNKRRDSLAAAARKRGRSGSAGGWGAYGNSVSVHNSRPWRCRRGEIYGRLPECLDMHFFSA